MATVSSLISKINSALYSLESNPFFGIPSSYDLSIALRNLKLLFICLRNAGDDDTHAMKSLFSRIEDAIGRIPTHDGLNALISELARCAFELNCLAKEVIGPWCANTTPNRLTLDDVVEVADAVLDGISDFLAVVSLLCFTEYPNQVNLRDVQDVMDRFEVQTRFLRDFLLFVRRTDAETQQMRNLLTHIRPYALDAAIVFHVDAPFSIDDADWVKEVQYKPPRVDPQIFEAYIQTLLSMSTLDQTDDFLSSLISLLWHVLQYRRHPRHLDSLKVLYDCLRLSRFKLKHRQNDVYQAGSGALIRDAGIVICSLYLKEVDAPFLSDLIRRFGNLQAQQLPETISLKANALDFGDSSNVEDIFDGKLQIETALASNQSSNTPRDVGFQEYEVSLILDRLTLGPKQLHYVPISGMTGLGKTTFALKLYNHTSVMYYFQARAWCTISQVLNKKRVLLQLLNQIQPGDYSRMDEDDLANKLRQSLKRKRYLIFLDDVWTLQALESLSPSFPNDRTQSRILLTSRLHTVVPSSLPYDQPHFLRLRKESECLEIIEMKLLHNVGRSTQLREFAKLSKGLPLTAVLVAGLLANTVQKGWEGILNHLRSGGIYDMEQCKIALEFSYQHLPYDLKLCFMYFGTFPEDEEINAKEMFRLWIAEGFVKKNDLLKKRIEDVAREYLDNLIQRNLVMVDKKRSVGGVKTCRVHDLLHDFCRIKGKQENLFHCLVQRNDELSDFNEPYNMERLSIHSTTPHFKESKLFCPRAHSVSFFTTSEKLEDSSFFSMLFIIQTFKLLKVLNVERIRFSTGIPSEIALFTQLTYLSVKCVVIDVPSSIGNLSNLETLIIESGRMLTVLLPYTIWNLQKLKCLHTVTGSILPIENIENSPKLLDLESICGVEFNCGGSMDKQMRKFPNIRRLKCDVTYDGEGLGELFIIHTFQLLREENLGELKIVVVPEYLSQLEELTFYMDSRLQTLLELDFGSNVEKIRKLKLHGLLLSREEIAVIGKIPNLEVFKLLEISFLGDAIEMEEGGFSKLRILEFCDCQYSWTTTGEGYRIEGKLETWTTNGDEPLPCLEKLVFRDCLKLKEIPFSCLESSSTLEEIEVSNCSSALESLVKEIMEVQKDFGNIIKLKMNHLSFGGMSNVEQCKIALEYSYQHLPYELKLCFMYFGVFPEDEEIYTKKLFRLWIAEGFVAKKNDLLEKRIEVVAGEYLDNLIQRNLVMIDKKRSMGGVKTCRVHDLLHDFCMLKGNQESLFHCLEQRKDDLANFNEPYNMKRLSIHSTPTHFKESRLFCPRAHSLSFFTTTEKLEDSRLFDMLFIIQTFKLLKVLNVERIQFRTWIPRDIALLTQLTYLSTTDFLPALPLSIGNLSNLKYLIIKCLSMTMSSLPYTIWNLQKLKYLHITMGRDFGFILPIENIENSPNLLELEAICGVEFHCDGSMEKQMKKFPNIRRLKCYISEESLERLNKIVVVPEFLNQLEDLTFSMRNRNQIELVFGSAAEKLRKVKLCGLMLSREEIEVIGKFPNLEVFKLYNISFLGGTIEMGEGEFLKLRILELRETKLETWTVAGEEPLPCLEKVLFCSCQKLKEIPCSYLEASSTLEEIVVTDCSSTLESLVKEIEQVQKDFGNSIKLQI